MWLWSTNSCAVGSVQRSLLLLYWSGMCLKRSTFRCFWWQCVSITYYTCDTFIIYPGVCSEFRNKTSHILIIHVWQIIMCSKSLYCISLGPRGHVFRLSLPQTGTYLDEIWNISEGARCTLAEEKWGKSPHGFHPRIPKRVFFCYQGNTASRPLILCRFRPFLKQ